MKEKEKSDNAWSDGLAILGQGRVSSAANRLYYAVFMAPYFYFLKRKQIDANATGKHSRVRELAIAHVKDKKNCRLTMNDLIGLRIKADYTPEEIEDYELNENLRERGNRLREHFLKKLGDLEK